MTENQYEKKLVRNLPKIGELAALVRWIKPDIDDDCREYPEDTPNIQLTIGWNPLTGNWNYQTGDTSFTGGAYGYPVWGIGYVTRKCNSREIARTIRADLLDNAPEYSEVIKYNECN